MIIKYKTNSNHSIQTIDTNEMSVLDKIDFIKKVYNFDIVILNDSGNLDNQKRINILNGIFN